MKIRFLQIQRVLQTALIVALLSVVTMTKAQTENITFADANVKAICVANWDTDGDGELNTTEAAAVTNLDGAFMFDDGIASFNELQFFTGLTSFGEDEFNSCTSLAAISIPSAVNSIGNYAFSDCSSLTSMTSYACTPPALGNDVFYNVPSVVVLNVPCHTSAMYQEADGWSDFSDYEEFEYGLCPIIFADDNVEAICVAHWDTNGDGELSYAEAAAVTNLGTYFKSTDISSFEELEYFTSLTSLSNTAFYGCTSLVSIALPSSISALGNGSFYNCTNLATMTVYAETPPTVGTNAFKNVPTTMVVQVLCEAYDAYLTASGWSGFANIQGFGPMCPITFADVNVKALCVANWDTDNDGELSYAEAAAVTDLGLVFNNNYFNVTSFNELQYFTGLTSIGDNAFRSCTRLSSVKIPNSVTLIEDYAFFNCSSLTSVEIPRTVTSIGTNSFGSCNGLEQIMVALGNAYYDSRENCNAIIKTSTNELVVGCKNTEIPNSVTSIGNYAFYSCTSLTSVEIPNSVTSIGHSTFESCRALTSIEIPNSVTSIGTNSFKSCRGLEQIVVASDNVYYDSRENCNAIINTSTNALITGCKNTVIPNSVTSISSYAFYNCTGLTSVEIPNSVTSIGDYAFGGCTGLTSVELPNSVTSIGSSAFFYCISLTSIASFADTPPTLGGYKDKVFYNVNKSIPMYVPCGASEAYQGTDGWNEFLNIIEMCAGEVEVTINPLEGGTVTGAGYYSEGDVCVLTATPNQGYIFGNWTENGRIVSMDSVCSFYAHPTTIMANFCSNNPITFADANVKALCVANWDTNGDGELSYVEAAAVTNLGQVFRNKSTITSFNELQYFINLTSIGASAFYNCTSLTSVEIPNSVTSIEGSAFSSCTNLESVIIGRSVASIGNNAFARCYHLNSITVFAETPPSLLYPYTDYPFSYVPNNIPVYVPCDALEDYQTASGWSRFTNIIGLCSGEVSITVNPSEGGTVTGAGYYTGGEVCVLTATPNEGFSFASWMDNGRVISMDSVCSFYAHPTIIVANFCSNNPIVFADTTVKALCVANWDTNNDGELSYAEAARVTTLGEVFKNNSSITSFDELQYFISLTTINNYAFSSCTNLTSVTIGNSVSQIGSSAFSNCNHLNSMIVLAETPPTLSYASFNYVPQNIPVYVPCDAMEDYQTDSDWSRFTNIIGLCSGEVSVTVNPSEGGTVTGAGYYTGGEVCVLTATPNEGFSFASWMENGRVISMDSVCTFYAHPTTIMANFCSNSPIVFADTTVKALCVANWDTNNDGELSYAEAARVTNLGEVFKNNSSITSFDELQYFINLTTINNYAFSSCTNLTSVTIGNSVSKIGTYAFSYCSGLEQIFVESGNMVYDSRGNCNAIIETATNTLILGCKYSVIPNTVTTIGENAFCGCNGLTSIVLPYSVTSVEHAAFDQCYELIAVYYTGDISQWCNIQFADFGFPEVWDVFLARAGGEGIIGDFVSNPLYYAHNLYIGNELVTDLVIPETVTEIKPWSFINATCLTSLIVGNSVTSIGSSAFSGCSGLTSLTIGNSVTSIGVDAFSYCSGLTGALIIPNSVTTLGFGAFDGCSGLTSLTIGNSLSTIEYGAFTFCSGLEQIVVESGNTVFDSRENCNAIIETASNTLVIGCKNTVIPNTVTSISCEAFGGCTELTSIEIPSSVTTIWDWAFYSCLGLTSMTVQSEIPPTIYYSSFLSCPNTILVYVPCGSVEAYQSASYWSEFTNIQELCTQAQTIELSQGWNWVSFNVETTLDDLKAALVEALPGTAISIKSQTQNTSYNPNNHRWVGSLAWDVAKMYMIKVVGPCEITFEGMPINPAEHPVSILNGANWIGFPLNANMSLSNAFADFAANGDRIKSQTNNALYNGIRWQGQLNTLVPNSGYIYISNSEEERTFIFPISTR